MNKITEALKLAEEARTPLKDLLRAVPKDGSDLYEEDKFCHHNIPYGRLIHEALAKIERLEALADHSGKANEMVAEPVWILPGGGLVGKAEPVKQEPVWSVEECDRVVKTLRCIQGIAERGFGRAMREDETLEQFVLGYVKQLEATIRAARAQEQAEQEPVGCCENCGMKYCECGERT